MENASALLLFGGVSLFGCAGQPQPLIPPGPAPAPAQVVVPGPVDSLWPRAIAFFANSMVPVQTIDKASGLIASDAVTLTLDQASAWLDCGKSASGTPLSWAIGTAVRFNVFMAPKGDSTSVRVNLFAGGPCQSTGKFESALLTAVTGHHVSVVAPPEPCAGGTLAEYRGEVINTTRAALPIPAEMGMIVCDWGGQTTGHFRLLPPLSSQGTFFLQASGDSIRMATTSDHGEHIAWSATNDGQAVMGTYRITRGQFAGQHGTWRVSLASGAPIPASLHSWR